LISPSSCARLHRLDLGPPLIGLDQALDQVVDPPVELVLAGRLVHCVLPWHKTGRPVIRAAFGSVLSTAILRDCGGKP